MSSVLDKSLMDIHPREFKGIIKDVPTLPVIFQTLFQKMQDPQVTVTEVAEIITQDQALTTRILSLVNSAFYSYSKEIKTISRAVVILGFQAVRSAALAVSVFDYFEDEESSAVDMVDFWRHSIAVAGIAKVLAEELRINQQEEAFVVGLLHDVGKLIEKRYFADDFTEVCRVAQEQHLSWYDCEMALFQVDHAMIAKVIFRSWNFPPSVVEAVQLHHNPSESTKVPQLTALLHVADFISYDLGLGSPGAFPPKECDPGALKLLNLSLPHTLKFYDKFEEELKDAMEILNLIR
ncbi:MAG: putative nucleotidyltransferase with HDIG domain [Candidatus Krumholzibacteriia bacterium]